MVWPWPSKFLYGKGVVAWMSGYSAGIRHFRFAKVRMPRLLNRWQKLKFNLVYQFHVNRTKISKGYVCRLKCAGQIFLPVKNSCGFLLNVASNIKLNLVSGETNFPEKPKGQCQVSASQRWLYYSQTPLSWIPKRQIQTSTLQVSVLQ